MVELTVLRRSHENRCVNVWMWFPEELFRLVAKNTEKQTAVTLPWIQAGARATVTAVGCLMEDGNGMG